MGLYDPSNSNSTMCISHYFYVVNCSVTYIYGLYCMYMNIHFSFTPSCFDIVENKWHYGHICFIPMFPCIYDEKEINYLLLEFELEGRKSFISSLD